MFVVSFAFTLMNNMQHETVFSYSGKTDIYFSILSFPKKDKDH